jgi:ribosomal protein S18 acetylase RimI-like enzyme
MNDIIKLTHQTKVFFWQSIAKEMLEMGDILAVTTGIFEQHLNLVIHVDVTVENIDQTIKYITEFYQKHNVPWALDITPVTYPKNIGTLLEQRGFICAESFPTMMYDLSAPLSDDYLNNFDIRIMPDEKSLDTWMIPMQEGFGSTIEVAIQYCNLHKKALRKNKGFQHLTAYSDDIPVASATLSTSNAGARLDDIATHPTYRRQGFASAIILYALKLVKQQGYKWCCLDSSQAGSSLYKKIGFKEVCTNKVYTLKPQK